MTQQEIILNSINEGVFTLNKDFQITSFNKAAERITGVSREEALGRTCWDVFHAELCENNCPMRKTFETGEPMVNATAHIINSEGERIPIRVSTAVLLDDQAEPVGGVETFQDLSQVTALRKELEGRHTFEDIVGKSPAMLRLFDILPQVADSDSTVLIQGASGTGKELVAKAIHHLSNRTDQPFVAVNCAALPDTLLESELFGHKAGAFTDAKKDKQGRFQLANRGTLFLDEIGDISPAMQARLLRVLQERTVEPLGSTQPVQLDVRVIAATNKDLFQLVQEGLFREDLYYRIRVVHLTLPSLKDRREDLSLLVDHLVGKFNRIQGKNIAGFSMDAMACLMKHDFPGNVRELENIIEQAFVLCRGELIEVHHLPQELLPEITPSGSLTGPMTLEGMERQLLEHTLHRRKGNRSQAAKDLGIHPSTLYRKIKALNIQPPEVDGRTSQTNETG